MEDYDAVRERGAKLTETFAAAYSGYVEELEASPTPDPGLLQSVRGVLERFETMNRPFEMLGKPAPSLGTVHAYGRTRDLEAHRGKVVMIDFWATWCGWCIKSFPALRDVRKAYEGKPFVVIGATEPARSVTDANFALDDDLKAKAASFTPVRERMPPNATAEQIARFRALEKDLIGQFVKNHEMTWDVVLIPENRATAAFALTGWPHAVVLDRQGRVRWFKRGALLRDRPEGIAKLRKVVDALLAE
jgi:thiol-disulfide isomerase/thioredoxin